MSLAERIERLDPRERRLLGVLVAVVAALIVLAVPLGAAAVVSGRRSDAEALRDAIEQIHSERALIARAQAAREVVAQRYASPAPPLAGLLEQWAEQLGIQIPESQDRPVVPHGKNYEERSTKIVLRKVGMLNLAKFLEKIKLSPHPLSVDRLNVRKRGTEPDSFDVDMIVSAYDRKAKAPKQPAEPPADEAREGSEL